MKNAIYGAALVALISVPITAQAKADPQAAPGMGATFTITLECVDDATGTMGSASADAGATYKDTQVELYQAWGEGIVANSTFWDSCRVTRTNPGGNVKLMWES